MPTSIASVLVLLNPVISISILAELFVASSPPVPAQPTNTSSADATNSSCTVNVQVWLVVPCPPAQFLLDPIELWFWLASSIRQLAAMSVGKVNVGVVSEVVYGSEVSPNGMLHEVQLIGA